MKNYDWTPDRELIPPDDMDYECPMCGRPTDSDDYCSSICFEASLI